MTIWRKYVALAVSTALVGGCTVPLKELRYPGGYLGYAADKHVMNAKKSKELQLLRAVVLVALASRMANATVRDGKEADGYVDYLGGAVDEINYLAGDLKGDGKGKACNDLTETTDICRSRNALFESDLPALEYKLFRLVLASLPQKQASDFVNAAKGGDIMGAGWKFLQLALVATDGLHRGAAALRSTQEILAQMVVDQRANGSKCADGRSTAIATVEDAVTCLGYSTDSLFRNPDRGKLVWPEDVPDPVIFAFFDMIRMSCAGLTVYSSLEEPEADHVKDRRDKCHAIRYDPTLRYGGLQLPPPPTPLPPGF